MEFTETCDDCDAEITLTHNLVAQPDEEVVCPGCGQIYIVEVPEEEDEAPYLIRYVGPMEIAWTKMKDFVRQAYQILERKTPWVALDRERILTTLRCARDLPDLPRNHKFAFSYLVDAIVNTPDSRVKRLQVYAFSDVFGRLQESPLLTEDSLLSIKKRLEEAGLELFPQPTSTETT
jgi:hypothetical protein